MQKQYIVDFLHGFLNSLLQSFVDIHGGLNTEITEGIASTIDAIFAMRSFGFVLVGIIAVLTARI